MKIKSFLKFYIGYNSFQVVNETGDKCTDILSKYEVLKSFGDAKLKRTDVDDDDEYMCSLMLFIADKDFKDEDWSHKVRTISFATFARGISIKMSG